MIQPCFPIAMCGPFCSSPPLGTMTVVKPALIAARTSTQVISARSKLAGTSADSRLGLTSNAPIKPKQMTLNARLGTWTDSENDLKTRPIKGITRRLDLPDIDRFKCIEQHSMVKWSPCCRLIHPIKVYRASKLCHAREIHPQISRGSR